MGYDELKNVGSFDKLVSLYPLLWDECKDTPEPQDNNYQAFEETLIGYLLEKPNPAWPEEKLRKDMHPVQILISTLANRAAASSHLTKHAPYFKFFERLLSEKKMSLETDYAEIHSARALLLKRMLGRCCFGKSRYYIVDQSRMS